MFCLHRHLKSGSVWISSTLSKDPGQCALPERQCHCSYRLCGLSVICAWLRGGWLCSPCDSAELSRAYFAFEFCPVFLHDLHCRSHHQWHSLHDEEGDGLSGVVTVSRLVVNNPNATVPQN